MPVPPNSSGDPDAEETPLGEDLHDLGGVALGLVVLGGDRGDPLASHLAGEIANHSLLVGQVKEILQRHGHLLSWRHVEERPGSPGA